MADVTITYKGNEIATMSATGTKTLLTEAKYCEDDITVAYTKPAAPSPSLQAKTNIDPALRSQTITADEGYDGLSSVQINEMPSGSASTPATTITANPTVSFNSLTGLITASVSKTQSVTPTVSPGYVSGGSAGTITVSGSKTQQLSTKAAATYTPTTADQTIASGQYLTGAQTIKGDANLLAENIKDGVTIFGVLGTYTGGSSSRTVTISLTNPKHSSEFISCDIYATNDGITYVRGLGGIASPTGSTDVTLAGADFGIIVNFSSGASMYIPPNGISVTGGVTMYLPPQSNYVSFEVTGDGTVTLNNVDYDF